MLQEFDIDVDLTTVFSLKTISPCSLDWSPIEHIRQYKYYWSSKTFSIWWKIEVYQNSMIQIYLDS